MFVSFTPLPVILDQRARPLNDGHVWIGEPDQDPELFPKDIYWDAEGLDPIDQTDGVPVIGGYARRSGSPARIYVDGNYSIRVRDRFGAQVYYDPIVVDPVAGLANGSGAGLVGYGSDQAYDDGTVGNELVPRVTLAFLPSVAPKIYKLAFVHDAGREGTFICRTGTAPSDPLQGIYVASNTANFYWERVWDRINGKPEWFGAVTGGPDCVAAINACIALCPITRLQASDYWISAPIKITASDRQLIGAGRNYFDIAGQATRILTTSATITMVQVGPDSFPGSINAMPRCMRVQDVYMGRTTGPSIAGAADGLVVQYALGAEIQRVKSVDSINSFRIYGSVACYIKDCDANRVVAGTGSGTDTWVGYMIDGTASIGLPGGNGSIYLQDTQAGCNISSLQTGASYGYRLVGNFQDTFLENPECVSCNIGISLEGGSPNNANVYIRHPVVDAPFKWGINLQSLANTATVNIDDPYVGLNASTQFGIFFNDSAGTVTVQNGNILCSSASSPLLAAIGIGGSTGSSGAKIDGTIIAECDANPVTVGGTGLTTKNVHIAPIISNAVQDTANAAVQVTGTVTASVIEPIIKGKANAFGQGIQVVGTGDARNEYRMSGVDSACIAGGSANKLTRNGVQITSTGLSGSNLVSGVMT